MDTHAFLFADQKKASRNDKGIYLILRHRTFLLLCVLFWMMGMHYEKDTESSICEIRRLRVLVSLAYEVVDVDDDGRVLASYFLGFFWTFVDILFQKKAAEAAL